MSSRVGYRYLFSVFKATLFGLTIFKIFETFRSSVLCKIVQLHNVLIFGDFLQLFSLDSGERHSGQRSLNWSQHTQVKEALKKKLGKLSNRTKLI